ncbi:MAG: hypothetical protein WBB85_21925 [Albidovulum sp.]|uniref:hypothetical protein n=1 Tax=Albidovulum sp. TaxID=1872424 RepID=UPI003CBFF12C
MPGAVLAPALVLAVALAPPARSAEPCTELTALVDAAGADFPNGGAAPEERETSPLLRDAETCAVTTAISGRREYHCAWVFPYRAVDALAAFDSLNGVIEQCFPKHGPVETDQGVNHPDFYDLRQYPLDRADLSVSLKDKVALQKTYVFLRIRSTDPE